VTVAQGAKETIRIAIDLNMEWDRIQLSSETPNALITGVVIVRKDFAAQHPEAVSAFLDRYAASVEFVNNNINEAAVLVGHYNIFPAAIAEKAIPYCNITFIEGQEMKEKLSGYLKVLFELNPQAVGGELPDDEFYFSR